ncbi:hypothetical protein C4J81_15500 [Deltaproteobacteria bacterium Smac51]|nr:hypothetical protein C4J81_15500 [Deltaproteobacteria bacterium Smac51]
MQKIKLEYTSAELAMLLGCTRQHIAEQALLFQWSCVARPKRLGGNLYLYEGLPSDIREIIISKIFNLDPQYLGSVDRPLEQVEASLQNFDRLPKKHQDVARARADILAACREFTLKGGCTVEAGREAYAGMYAKKLAPGIESGVYEVVKKISAKTLERWQTLFNKGGLAELAPHFSDSGRNGRITPEMELIFRGAIAQTPHIRVPKLLELMRTLLPQNQWVHKATVHRWFAKYKAKYPAEYALNTNPLNYKNSFMPAFGTLSTAPFAGHTWEMDSTPADIMTADGKRCAIVAAIDVYSRRAVVVVANVSNSDTVAACIRKGLLMWGKPQVIRKDNGADYSSTHIRAVTTGLDIDTPKLPPYSPEHKGHIERFFRTISSDLEEMLPGYAGHKVEERAALRAQATWAKKVFKRPTDQPKTDANGKAPQKPAVDVPLTQAEFMHLIECWLDVYENRIHSGFARTPGKKLKDMTPRQAFESSPRKPFRFHDERMLDILLAKVDRRKVQKKGIFYKGGIYNSTSLEFQKYIGRYVDLRLNPDNAGGIYVFDGSKFIDVAHDKALEGQRLEDYERDKKRLAKEHKENIRAANTLSKNIDVSYTVNLETGKIRKAQETLIPPMPEPESTALNFQPNYENEFTAECRKAAEAYDGTAAESGGQPGKLYQFERPEPKTIFPVSAQEDGDDPLYPTGADAKNPIKVFEYYMYYATGPGIKREDVWHIFRLWDNYTQVQRFHPRPDEEQLNIIEAADEVETAPQLEVSL